MHAAPQEMPMLSGQILEETYILNGQYGYLIFDRVDGRVLIADAARALQHSAT